MVSSWRTPDTMSATTISVCRLIVWTYTSKSDYCIAWRPLTSQLLVDTRKWESQPPSELHKKVSAKFFEYSAKSLVSKSILSCVETNQRQLTWQTMFNRLCRNEDAYLVSFPLPPSQTVSPVLYSVMPIQITLRLHISSSLFPQEQLLQPYQTRTEMTSSPLFPQSCDTTFSDSSNRSFPSS